MDPGAKQRDLFSISDMYKRSIKTSSYDISGNDDNGKIEFHEYIVIDIQYREWYSVGPNKRLWKQVSFNCWSRRADMYCSL